MDHLQMLRHITKNEMIEIADFQNRLFSKIFFMPSENEHYSTIFILLDFMMMIFITIMTKTIELTL